MENYEELVHDDNRLDIRIEVYFDKETNNYSIMRSFSGNLGLSILLSKQTISSSNYDDKQSLYKYLYMAFLPNNKNMGNIEYDLIFDLNINNYFENELRRVGEINFDSSIRSFLYPHRIDGKSLICTYNKKTINELYLIKRNIKIAAIKKMLD